MGEEAQNDEDSTSHHIFTELEELCYSDHGQKYSLKFNVFTFCLFVSLEWKETARWVKFEEDVEEGGEKWSKPHVATLSLHSLFDLRSCMLRGTVLLDLVGTNLEEISGDSLTYCISCNE